MMNQNSGTYNTVPQSLQGEYAEELSLKVYPGSATNDQLQTHEVPEVTNLSEEYIQSMDSSLADTLTANVQAAIDDNAPMPDGGVPENSESTLGKAISWASENPYIAGGLALATAATGIGAGAYLTGDEETSTQTTIEDENSEPIESGFSLNEDLDNYVENQTDTGNLSNSEYSTVANQFDDVYTGEELLDELTDEKGDIKSQYLNGSTVSAENATEKDINWNRVDQKLETGKQTLQDIHQIHDTFKND